MPDRLSTELAQEIDNLLSQYEGEEEACPPIDADKCTNDGNTTNISCQKCWAEYFATAVLSHLASLAPNEALLTELKTLLVKTFAQTVEYGAMCSECCSSQGDGDRVLCEMSQVPLSPHDYCPQQIEVIESVLPQIIVKAAPIILAKAEKELQERQKKE